MGKRQVDRGTSPYENVKECTTILYHINSEAKTPSLTFSLLPVRSPTLHNSSAILLNSCSLYCHIPSQNISNRNVVPSRYYQLSPKGGWGQTKKTTETIKTEVFHIQLHSVFHTCRGLYLKILNFSLSRGQRLAPIECGHLEASIKQ